MREIGTLIWVVFVIIGVLSSIVSSIRKRGAAPPPLAPQAYARAAIAAGVPVARPPQPLPPPAPAAPVRTPRPVAARVPTPISEPTAPRWRPFARREDLVRAVIAAEVLGKPRGLRDEHFAR